MERNISPCMHLVRQHSRKMHVPRDVHRPKSMGLGGRAIGPTQWLSYNRKGKSWVRL